MQGLRPESTPGTLKLQFGSHVGSCRSMHAERLGPMQASRILERYSAADTSNQQAAFLRGLGVFLCCCLMLLLRGAPQLFAFFAFLEIKCPYSLWYVCSTCLTTVVYRSSKCACAALVYTVETMQTVTAKAVGIREMDRYPVTLLPGGLQEGDRCYRPGNKTTISF